MTQLAVPPRLGDLAHLLGEGLAALDITQADHDQAVRRYEDLAEVLDERWAPTRGSNAVFPQGSFRLGTVVRNIHRNDDIDIDIVALRDITRVSISQEQLKDEVGDAVQTYARRPGSDYPQVEESSRCWTLSWSDMHMDILPAIPSDDTTGEALLITDKDVRSWLPSNPIGYGRWFGARTQVAEVGHEALAKRLDVQPVPEWRRRTVLQRVVQALKRHRDVYFGARLHERPASIVITTLAAHAYTGGSDLYDALRQVTLDMEDHLDFVDGTWVLQNPAQPGENFTDSWAAEPGRAANFFEWLEAARETFAGLETSSGLQHTIPLLEGAFGARFARGASRGLADLLGSSRREGTLRMYEGGALGTAAVGAASAAPRTVRSHGFAGGPRSL